MRATAVPVELSIEDGFLSGLESMSELRELLDHIYGEEQETGADG